MLQTNASDFMELFARLFDTSEHARTLEDGRDSTLRAVAPEYSMPPVPLTELMSDNGCLLFTFLDSYALREAPTLEKEFRELEQLIRENDGDFFLGGQPARQMLDFVYPLV